MEQPVSNLHKTTGKRGLLLALLGVIFVAANLRAPLTSVGPVIDQISAGLALSNASAGLVTTIPLLAFGFLSGWIPRISERFGMEIVLFVSLVVLAFGLFIRSLADLASLFIGAALVGTAITVGNVLMPAYIKNKFPNRIGSITGIYSVAMNLTAALAAGFSISLGNWTNMGWQGAIGIWLVLTLFTLFIWAPQLKSRKNRQSRSESSTAVPKINVYRSKLAWAVTFFMGIQSLLFYCLTAWLPKIVQDWGVAVETSGWVLSYIQFAQLPMTFLGAIIATKLKDQRFLGILVGILFTLGLLGLLVFKTQYMLLSCILIGVGSGLAFSLSMLFFVLRTGNVVYAAKLSGMAQSIGYLVAATGPPIIGALFDFSGSWNSSFIFMLLMATSLLFFGWIAGKDKTVEAE